MDDFSYNIRSSRIVADGAVRPGVVRIRGEKIEAVDVHGEGVTGAAQAEGSTAHEHEIDVGDLVVMPGLVDTHVHVNEPGRTDWEGFETAGRSAAAGGITTIVVMPLNCTPAATSMGALLGEAKAAQGKCLVDFGLWGGLVPENVDQLERMWDAGALGFKAFMVESGVEDFAAVSQMDLLAAAPVLARLGAPLLVHAEDPEDIAGAREASGLQSSPRDYACYLASRPPRAEEKATRTVFALYDSYVQLGLRSHIVHVASSGPALLIGAAWQNRRRMSGETCPHYLTFAAEDIPEGATVFKCAPPIRNGATRERLWELLREGYISMVVSDHSPCPPALKHLEEGNFATAWGGISSLQLGLSAVWTGASTRGFELPQLARWMSSEPAKLAGLSGKGRIAEGCDADLVIFDPDGQWTVRAEALHHRWKLTPYDGMTLRGVVKRTILRGRTIFDASLANPFPSEPIGQWIKRAST